jgi:hypothetical protein
MSLGEETIVHGNDTSQPIRVGILSPNVLLNVTDHNAMYEDPDLPWRFDSLAKRASLLFDKLYISEDLEVTCSLLDAFGDDNDPKNATIRHLIDEGLIFLPRDAGYSSGAQLITENLAGTAASLNEELMRIGNPTGIEDDEAYLIGQPDVGDFVESNGCHPRDMNLGPIRDQQRRYESLLLRRNAAILRQAGFTDVAVIGRLINDMHGAEYASPV